MYLSSPNLGLTPPGTYNPNARGSEACRAGVFNPRAACGPGRVFHKIQCVMNMTHSPTLTSLHLRHSSFSNPSAALPTSQRILQPFRCFTYIIGTSPTSPGEPPIPLWWCLIYPWWFCNLQWLRPAGLYERCKLALELKRLKTPAVGGAIVYGPAH